MQSRLLLVTAAIAALSFGQAARKPGAPTKAWQAPRNPDGVADIQGFWNNSTLTPLERPKALGTKEFYTEEEFAELSRRVREGKIGAEADLGAAAEQTLRYDLSLYGFDITKATFASNR